MRFPKYNSVKCTECVETSKIRASKKNNKTVLVLHKETTEQKKEAKGGRWASVERRAAADGTACRRRAVSEGNGDSLSRVGNEVSVVIKRKVSMAMQRAVCTANLLGVEGAK